MASPLTPTQKRDKRLALSDRATEVQRPLHAKLCECPERVTHLDSDGERFCILCGRWTGGRE